jgi:hypothetical protein
MERGMSALAICLQRARDAWAAGMTISELYVCDKEFAELAAKHLTVGEINALAYEWRVLDNTLKLNETFHA